MRVEVFVHIVPILVATCYIVRAHPVYQNYTKITV